MKLGLNWIIHFLKWIVNTKKKDNDHKILSLVVNFESYIIYTIYNITFLLLKFNFYYYAANTKQILKREFNPLYYHAPSFSLQLAVTYAQWFQVLSLSYFLILWPKTKLWTTFSPSNVSFLSSLYRYAIA